MKINTTKQEFVQMLNSLFAVKDLKGKNVNIWNGFEWSEVTVRKTGEDQELVKVSSW